MVIKIGFMQVRHIKKSHHQGSVPPSSRVARGGRRHKVTVPSVAPPKSVITPSTSTAGAQTRAVEGIQTQATVYGKESCYTLLLLLIITISLFAFLYNLYLHICACVFWIYYGCHCLLIPIFHTYLSFWCPFGNPQDSIAFYI